MQRYLVTTTPNIIAIILAVLLFLLTILHVTTAQAAPNLQLNYQGKLTNSSNVAVANTSYQMEFSLYTATSGGTAIWTETRTGANKVTVENGLFSVMLGSVTPLTGIDFNQTLYLGVTIEADSQMTPRKILGAVPAAFEANNANTVGGVASTSLVRSNQSGNLTASSSGTLFSFIQNGVGKILSVFSSATEVFTILNNGNVGIGSSSPAYRLGVAGAGFFGGDLTATGTLNISATSTLATTTVTTLNLANALAVSSGGTSFNTYATGDVVYASGANTLAKRTVGADGTYFGVVSGVPTWRATTTLGIALADTTGTLSAARGGTGLASYTTGALLYASGASTLTTQAIGSTGDILSVVSGVPTWSATSSLGSQSANANLTAIAGLTSAADTLPYFTGAGTAALTTLTTFGRALLDDTSSTTGRASLGVIIGTDVQAFDADLSDLADLTIAGNFINTANPWADNEVADNLTVSGGTIGANSISGLQTTTATLTFGDNGDNIVFDSNTWDISGAGVASGFTGLTSTGSTTISDLAVSGAFRDGLSGVGTTGMVLQTTGTSTRWVATSTLGLVGLTGIGPAGFIQTGPTVTMATATAAFNGLTLGTVITATGNTVTYTPSISGTLGNAGLTNSTIAFATGSTGTDITWSASPVSLGGTATLNIPNASASARGLLTATDWTTFNGKISSTSLDTIAKLDSLITDVTGVTGTGSFVLSASPTFTGTLAAALATFSGTLNVTGTSTLATTTIASSTITTLTLNNALALTSGGTGATTAALARTNLGATTVGSNLFTLTNPGAVSLMRINADNTVTTVATNTLGIALADTTGTLSAARGGTGLTAFGGVNTILYTSAQNVLATSTNFTFDGTRLSLPILAVSGTSTFTGTTTLATTTISDLAVSGAFRDGLSGVGTTGMVLQTTGTSTRWVATSTLGLVGLTGIGPAGFIQTGPTVTMATATAAFNGLTLGTVITATGNTVTYTPSISGTLGNAGLTNSTIAFATGSTGTDITWSASPVSLGGTATLNIPNASASARGLLTATDWTTFNGKISSTSLDTIAKLDSLITDVTGVTGTGSFVLSASPTFTGTLAAALATFSGTLNVTGTSTLATTTIASSTITTLTLNNALALTSGGTGATTAALARTNLGATTVGSNLFTLTNPGAVSLMRINADNTVTTVATNTLGIALADTTGTLSAARGGTGLTAFGGVNTILYTSAQNVLATSTNFTFDGTNFVLGTDVGLSRGAANTLTLATGDSLNLVSGALQVAGTTALDSSQRFFATSGALGAGTLAYSFSGDTNTGIYGTGADIMRLVTNGADRMTIDANGNVGIGTTTPGTRLTVSGGLSSIAAGRANEIYGMSATTSVTTGYSNTQLGAFNILAAGTAAYENTIVGAYATSTGNANTLIGANSSALGSAQVIIGANLTSASSFATLIGSASSISGGALVSIGVNNSLTHNDAMALGYGLVSQEDYEVILGSNDTASTAPSIRLVGATNAFVARSLFELDTSWIVSTEGSQRGRATFGVYDTAERVFMQADATGSGANVFFNAGRVSIGTTSTSSLLTVQGDINISDTAQGYKIGGNRVLYASSTNASILVGVGSGLNLNSTSYHNIAIGNDSLGLSSTTISDNIAIGLNALYRNAGNGNLAIGRDSLSNNLTGFQNIAIGNRSLELNASGRLNIALGESALQANIVSYGNTVIGFGAGSNILGNATTTDGYNTILGYQTGLGITTGTYNTIIGANVTGLSPTLFNNIILADGSGNQRINVDSSGNVTMGTTTAQSSKLTIQGTSVTEGLRVISTAALGTVSGGGVQMVTSVLPTAANQRLGLLYFGSSQGTTTYSSAAISGWSSEAHSATNVGGYLRFETTPNGPTGRLERMRIDENGNVGIGTTSPLYRLHVLGTAGVDRDSTDVSGTTRAFHVTGTQSVAHSGSFFGIDSQPLYSGTTGNTLAAIYGVRGVPQHIGSGDITAMYGIFGQPQNTSSGNVNVIRGVQSLPINSGTGTTTQMIGVMGQPRASNGGVTTMYGGYFDCMPSGATAVIANCTALYLGAPTTTLGTITNYTALLVDAGNIKLLADGTGIQNSKTDSALFIGAGNDMALYHDGTNSYIRNSTGALFIGDVSTGDVILSNNGGKVGIGTSTPGQKLSVVDAQATGYVARITNTNTTNTADGLLISLGVANASRNTGNYFVGFSTLDGTVAGKIQGTTGSAVLYTTTAADLAEYFPVADGLKMPEPGEIVTLDPNNDGGVKLAAPGTMPFGIVATSPGFLGNGPICKAKDINCDADYAKDNAIISLSGQVPVRVNLEGGPIKIGDDISLSSVTGVGKKATAANEAVVGIALEDYVRETTSNTIRAFVSNKRHQTLADTVRLNQFSVDLEASSTVFTELQNDPTDTIWNRIVKLAQGFKDGILTLAGVKAETMEANSITTDKLCVGTTCISEDELKEIIQQRNISAPGRDDNDADTNPPEQIEPDEVTEPTPVPAPAPAPTPEPQSEPTPEPTATPEVNP